MECYFISIALESQLISNLISLALVISLIVVVFVTLFNFTEGLYVDFIGKKPFFRHLYFKVKDLELEQKIVLERQFKFYKKLDTKEQRFFRHRVFKYLLKVKFIGKEGLVVNNEMTVLIAATAVMLTYGYRDYTVNFIDKIVIYPSIFYSKVNKEYHKGHFNPGYRALILSWEDFKIGYEIEDDNLNLGIHEFVHALHLSYLHDKGERLSANIFINSLKDLTKYLETNFNQKQKMKNSDYFRSYAFENDFEFIAVIIENFIETPAEFKNRFPDVYKYIKQMLNFNFPGY